MKLKINFLSQINVLMDLILMSLICFLFIYFGWNSLDFKLIIFFLIPYFLMFFFPVIILYFNYLLKNKGVVLEIEQNVISIKKKNICSKYNNTDIEEIIFYVSGSRNRGYGGLAHSNYYYAKIKFLDNTNFIITSLYSSKIDKILQENFREVKITTEKVFYPMIS